jgi:hypothetical protein
MTVSIHVHLRIAYHEYVTVFTYTIPRIEKTGHRVRDANIISVIADFGGGLPRNLRRLWWESGGWSPFHPDFGLNYHLLLLLMWRLHCRFELHSSQKIRDLLNPRLFADIGLAKLATHIDPLVERIAFKSIVAVLCLSVIENCRDYVLLT